jgi:hypothetical protein
MTEGRPDSFDLGQPRDMDSKEFVEPEDTM